MMLPQKYDMFLTYELYEAFIEAEFSGMPFTMKDVDSSDKGTGYIGKFNGIDWYVDDLNY